MESTKTPIIILDERERGEIRSTFNQFPCKIQIETLPTADYLIDDRIGIERKRGDDLVASICDNRFFKQIEKMLAFYPESMIILENPDKMFERSGVASASIYGALIYALYKHHIPLITTLNVFETCQTIWSFAKYFQQKHPYTYTPLQLPPTEIDRSIQTNFIQGLIGISEIKATRLLDEFGTPWGIIQALQKSSLNITSSGKVKIQHSPFQNLKGFGPKFILQNQNLLKIPFHVSINLKKPTWTSYHESMKIH